MNWLRRIGSLGPLAAFSVVMPPVSGVLLLGTLHKVGPWLKGQEELGLFLYVAAFTVLGGLALLPTYAPSLLGGWAFGVPGGAAGALTGFVGAALVSYVISRGVAGNRLEQVLAQHTKWNAVSDALMRSGFWKAVLIVTLLRLPPNAPFAASNVAMAAIGVPLLPYAIGTLLGLAPRTTAVVIIGAGLSQLDLGNRSQAGWMAAGIVITFLVLGVIGWMANRALRQVEADARRDATAPERR